MKIKSGIVFSQLDIIALYTDAGWTAYINDKAALWGSVLKSLKTYSIFDNTELIAFARLLGDGITTVVIQDIVVKSTYRHKGIGSLLLKTILTEWESVRQIILLCDNEQMLQNFYEKNGLCAIENFNVCCYGILR